MHWNHCKLWLLKATSLCYDGIGAYSALFWKYSDLMWPLAENVCTLTTRVVRLIHYFYGTSGKFFGVMCDELAFVHFRFGGVVNIFVIFQIHKILQKQEKCIYKNLFVSIKNLLALRVPLFNSRFVIYIWIKTYLTYFIGNFSFLLGLQ